MAVQMEGLSFEIDAKTGDTAKQLDALADSLGRIKQAVAGGMKMTSAANQISKLNNALAGMKSTSVSRLRDLGDAFGKLSKAGSINIPSTLPKRISEISNAAGGISQDSIDKLKALSDALQGFKGLTGVKIPNVSTAQADTVQTPSEAVSDAAQDIPSVDATPVDNVGKSLSEMNSQAKKGVGIFHELGARIKSLGNTGVDKAATGIASLAKNAAQLPMLFGTRLASSMRQATSSVGGLFSGLVRIAKFRLFRTIIKLFTEGMSKGLENLYYWSQMAGNQFSASMDRIATASQYVSNSFAAMAAPLLDTLSPVIDFIADKIVALFNMINQVIARLTGKSTYIAAKKVAATWQDAADSAGKGAAGAAKKATDEIKKYVLGFDELNILGSTDKSSSGGGGGSGSGGGGGGGNGVGAMFEELPIDSGLANFADQIKELIANADWEGLGRTLGDKVNGLIEMVPWADWGKKFGFAINGAVQTAYFFLDEVNFRNLGNHVAEFINNALAEINFEYVGRLLVKPLLSLVDFIIGVVEDLDWGLVAKSLHDFFIGVFHEVSDWLDKYDWENLGETLYTKVKDFFTNLHADEIADAFWEMMGKAVRAAALTVKGFFNGVSEDIKKWWNEEIQGETFEETATNLWDAIGKGIQKYAPDNLYKTYIIDPFMNGLIGEDKWEDLQQVGKDIMAQIQKGIEDVLGVTWVKEHIIEPLTDNSHITLGDLIGDPLVSGTLGTGAVAGAATNRTVTVDFLGNQTESFTQGKKAFEGIVDSSAEKTLVGGVTKLFKDAKEQFEEVRNGTATKTVDANVDSSFTRGKSEFDGLKNNSATKTISGYQDKAFATVRDAFAKVVSNTAKKTATAGVTKDFNTVKGWYHGIYSNSAKKTVYGNPTAGFKTTRSWYLGVNSNSATKTTYGNQTRSFKDAKSAYNGLQTKGVTVSVSTSGTGKLDSMQRKIDSITRGLKKMKNVNVTPGRASGGVFEHGAWHSIPQYASGTTNAGSMFIAGERGPELVGHVGGRTEVLNRSQLASTMYASVRNAMAEVGSATVGALASAMAASTQALSHAVLYSGQQTSDSVSSAMDGVTFTEQPAPRDDSSDIMRTMMTATAERQNQLLREQNGLLRQLLDKPMTAEITTKSVRDALSRQNRRDGRTVVPVSN